MVQLILAILLSLLPMWAQAATYYVSTTGSNSNDGLSEATPWLTIKKAVDTMVAGDTTYVRGGTYTQSDATLTIFGSTKAIKFTNSGTQSQPIRLLAYPGETPIIDGNNVATFGFWLGPFLDDTNTIAWVEVSGFEIKNSTAGIRIKNGHDLIISNNYLHDFVSQGILGQGIRVLITRNRFFHIGDFVGCAAGGLCNQQHGVYANGINWTITNNQFVEMIAWGVQQNAQKAFSATTMPSTEYSDSTDWIIANNIFAYNYQRGGVVVWGGKAHRTRIENNIFYENASGKSTSQNGIEFVAASGSTDIAIKNNHAYATASPGATVFIQGTFHATTVQTGNVINVSTPAFVNGGANSLPASPDFRLTARAPVDIALATEIPTNGVVGPFQPPAAPTATMTTNKITLTFPMLTATPIQNLSTAGVTFSCTSNVCPGSPAVSSVSRVAGADNVVEVTFSGITSNACLSHADPITISYASGSGTWTGNDNVGPAPGLQQKILSFTSLTVTNNCTGSGPPSSTSSHISYPMENGTGTTVSDTSGNALHATTSGTWVSGHTGYGIQVASGTTQQTTIPYGSGINPSTQSMTWVVPVYVPTGQTGVIRYVFGPELGTNQRGYVGATTGTWRVGRQSTSISSAGASNLAVTEGWNHLCVRWDSGTDTVTLYKNGVAGTGGATGSYTSFTFATNFEFPIIGTSLHTTVPEAIFDDVQVFTSLQDCATLYADWNAPTPAAGTLAQAAVQYQGTVLDTAGNPIVIGPSVQTIEVPAAGGAVILFQVHCTNVADCALTAFKLVYTKNGSSIWQQVPDTETADGTWMYGITTEANLNNGTRSTRLTGSCTVTTGATQVTSAQTPAVDLPQDGCVVLGYMVRVGSTQAGNYFDYKLQTEAGVDFTTYTQTARMRVVNPMASGVGF